VISAAAPLLLRAIAMAIPHRRAVYDCIYLALAEREGCELLTADDQFARGLRGTFPFIVTLVACP
jgi:predicted nucleic acid-binding protein